MPTTDITQEQYESKLFPANKRKKALEHALDIRKFEIELYWKRATYFWTFIGAIFAGYIAIQASKSDLKQDLAVILSCLGFVFSIAWFCVNRGSKQWQENWEKHVDSLEDSVTGPLYKVVLTRRKTKPWKTLIKERKSQDWKEKCHHLVTGPSPLSVSKINQIISLYVSAIWIYLVIYTLPEFDTSRDINPFYTTVLSMSLMTSAMFFFLGRTYNGGYWHNGTIRTSAIKND
ncbi:hypothetical protein ACJJIX_04140 [Microbulbifer sp. VAAC004]|uniref:RipA family octameric membrane protein n=1 Tax=unclassified Microbulbifer TaxID=2619833 RepID=UPI004039ADD2